MIPILNIAVDSNATESAYLPSGEPRAVVWEVYLRECPPGYGSARVVVAFRRVTGRSSTVSARLYLDPRGGRDCSGEGITVRAATARMSRALEAAAERLDAALQAEWRQANGRAA